MLKPPYILMKDTYGVRRIWAQDPEESGNPQDIAAVCSDGATTPDEDQVHGEFICMACNAHESLLELANNCVHAFEQMNQKEIAESTRQTLTRLLWLAKGKS